jgi:hypothetical protein
VPNNFSTIGFDVPTQDALSDLFRIVATSGTVETSPLGRYVRWPEGPGEQLWAQVDQTGAAVGLNPYFEGSAGLPVAVVDAVRDPEHPMDGYVWCWAAPRDDDPESGDYPVVIDLPDFDAATDGLTLPWFGSMQVAAFARSLDCWPDDAAYEASEAEKWAHRAVDGEREVKGFAAESFIPTGTFSIGEQADAPPSAQAWFTGHVLDTTVRTNAHTGLTFHHVLVHTLGGEYDVVADPEVLDGEPAVGGVVQVSAWLTGRLLPAS